MTASPTRGVLRGDWQVLESSDTGRFVSLPVKGFEEAGVRIAVDEDGCRHLLVKTAIQPRSWTQIDSPLKDAVHALTFGGDRALFLDVRCSARRLFDVFDELILDVLGARSGVNDLGAAIDATLAQWRSMFRAAAVGAFGKERRYGLFAELLVVEACVLEAGASGLAMWTGPAGAPHDFEVPHGCLEVKAIGGTSGDITIHGFRQLQTDRGDLYVMVYSLAESSDGRTIADVVSSIESHLGAGALRAQLASVGYVSSAPDERLVVVDSFAVPVGDQIPALTAHTVAASAIAGIRRVEYDVPLALLSQLADPSPTNAVIARMFES